MQMFYKYYRSLSFHRTRGLESVALKMYATGASVVRKPLKSGIKNPQRLGQEPRIRVFKIKVFCVPKLPWCHRTSTRVVREAAGKFQGFFFLRRVGSRGSGSSRLEVGAALL